MKNHYIAFCRFLISAWIGAAVLFVVSLVKVITNEKLSSDIRDVIALINFPIFYLFGFVLVTVCFMMSTRVVKHYEVGKIRLKCFQILLFCSLLVMALDYFLVYTPMRQMIIESKGGARPDNFQLYHKISMYVSAAHLNLSFMAAILICWPRKLPEKWY
jgi:hypothetical protein